MKIGVIKESDQGEARVATSAGYRRPFSQGGI
jgi:alanine dehydrogenase